jgi:hypothetical protein
MSTTRKRAKKVSAITGPRVAIDTSGLDLDQRRRVANTRSSDTKAKMKKKYDKREVTVGNKTRLSRGAQSMAGIKGSKANAVAELHRSANNAQTELKNSERIKNRERVAKKKREAAENKEPLNYGTPMNYSMKPGSREIDTPGAFRDTSINKHMGAPVNYGTEGGDDKKKKVVTKAKPAAKPKKKMGPKRTSLNPFSKDYTGVVSGSNPYIKISKSQKSEKGTIFE